MATIPRHYRHIDVTDTDVVRPDRKPDINVSCARNGLAH
jgi:hypothetical protein